MRLFLFVLMVIGMVAEVVPAAASGYRPLSGYVVQKGPYSCRYSVRLRDYPLASEFVVVKRCWPAIVDPASVVLRTRG
jgi:hypothetical protein